MKLILIEFNFYENISQTFMYFDLIFIYIFVYYNNETSIMFVVNLGIFQGLAIMYFIIIFDARP